MQCARILDSDPQYRAEVIRIRPTTPLVMDYLKSTKSFTAAMFQNVQDRDMHKVVASAAPENVLTNLCLSQLGMTLAGWVADSYT